MKDTQDVPGADKLLIPAAIAEDNIWGEMFAHPKDIEIVNDGPVMAV